MTLIYFFCSDGGEGPPQGVHGDGEGPPQGVHGDGDGPPERCGSFHPFLMILSYICICTYIHILDSILYSPNKA